MFPIVVHAAECLAVVDVQPISTSSPWRDFVYVKRTITLYLWYEVFSNTFVRITFEDFLADALTEAENRPSFAAHGIQAPTPLKRGAPFGRPRALHRYTDSVGFIVFLVLTFLAFTALSAIVMDLRFRWRIQQAVKAADQTLTRDSQKGEEG